MKTPPAGPPPRPPAVPSTAARSPHPAGDGGSAPPSTEGFDGAPSGARRGPDLDGGLREAAPATQVDSPFTPEERAALSKKIPCPALAGLFNAGQLKVAKDGTVTIPDLERALSRLGPDAAVRRTLASGADATDAVKGSFNLFTLNGSNLDHTGSSGIRANGVHPERFERLMSFSADGERLTAADLSRAASHFANEDPGLRGRITQSTELSSVLLVFGRRAADGSRYFTRDDARQLFVEGRFPAGWEPPAVPDTIRLADVLGGTAMSLFRQLLSGGR